MKGVQLTKKAFEDEWYKMVQTGLTYVDAYEELEEWHYEKCGARRYSCYDSFRHSKDKKRRNKGKK